MEGFATRVEGKEINGKYRVIRFLGEGGMGLVFQGIVLATGEDCAIKFVRPEVAANPDALQRFVREARVVAALRHPNIVGVFGEMEKHEELTFIAMELLKGMGLDEQVKKGPLPWREVVEIGLQATVPLGFAHSRGIIHRDLKPENLFIASNGTLKVMDFGIAKVLDATRMTMPKMLLGSLAYMSREQARGDADLDQRSDVYSLGVVLYQLLSGQLPYGNGAGVDLLPFLARIAYQPPKDIADYVPGLPAPVLTTLRRALEPERDARYPSMEAFADALRGCLVAGEKTAAGNPTVNLHLAATLSPQVVEGIPEVIPAEESSRRVALNENETRSPPSKSSTTVVFVFVFVAAVLGGLGSWLAFRPTAPVFVPNPAPAKDLAAPLVAAVVEDMSKAPLPPRDLESPRDLLAPKRMVDETAAGSISVRSYPSANVRIDGRDAGPTPVQGVSLRPGKHSVELVAEDGRREVRVVHIQPGRTETLRVKFP